MITHAVIIGCSPMRVVHNPSNQGRETSRKALRAQLNPQHLVVVLKIESIHKHDFEIISSKHYLMSLLLTRKKEEEEEMVQSSQMRGIKTKEGGKVLKPLHVGALPFHFPLMHLRILEPFV